MCGICGAVNLGDGQPIDRHSLDLMCATLFHRGPDSSGNIITSQAGLAMRRLAIIDVVGGQQPLTNETGDIHLICNGEIYNFPELRRKLLANGHHFRSGSDCEVIVHLYEEQGEEFLTLINGMFALALWDDRTGRLILARDRVGIKPLYYAEFRGTFLFGSEPKALLAYPGFPREIDLISLQQYLTFEYVPTPRSIFEGVKKVRPGHALIVDRAGTTERPYWRLDLSPEPSLQGVPDDVLANRLWETLRESVRLEMISDVPLGVFLSGGLDSSSIAAAMVDLGQGDVRSFAIGFSDPSFDESAHARRVASFLGTTHSELILEPKMLSDLVPSVVDFLDEPLADASIVPTYLLSRFARQNVTVALGGDGGDELFAGYPTLQAHRLAGYYRRLPLVLREDLIEPLVRKLPVSLDNMSLDFRAKRFILGMGQPDPEQHHVWLGAYSPAESQRLLTIDVRERIGGSHPFSALDEHRLASSAFDPLSQVLYLDMKMYLEGDILTKVDRASMGCSLEVRVPFLNRLMLDFATHLPIDHKLRRFTRKYLLRRAMRGRLPDDIINRPKKGFGMPVSKWLRGDLREPMTDLLGPDRIRRQGLFDSNVVDNLVTQHLSGTRDNRKQLWSLLVFQMWRERYIAGANAGRPHDPTPSLGRRLQ